MRPALTFEPLSLASFGGVGNVEAEVETLVLPSFDAVYAEYFPFVFRTLRRLGVPESSVEDASQEAFVVVHRRLAEFEGRASIKTWLFRIVWRIAQDHRRASRRGQGEVDPDTLPATTGAPEERRESIDAMRALQEVLDELDEEKRAVFVLAELEQLSLRDIAAAVGENVNTVASRLRAARQAFDRAVARRRARDAWRPT